MYGDGPVFKAEGASFRDQPYAEQLPQGLWTTGLCDCHEDAHICVKTAIMPCVSYAQNTEIVNRGTIPCMNAGLIHLALGFVGCCWLYAFPSRSRLREHFALPEEPCRDFWVHLFCTPCAICQESRELKNRGPDPSIGMYMSMDLMEGEKTRISIYARYECGKGIKPCKDLGGHKQIHVWKVKILYGRRRSFTID